MPKLVSDEAPEIYHYTTITGLTGIIESQSLWATHYAYLNDSEEVRHFGERLEKILQADLEETFSNVKNQAPEIYKRLVDEHKGIANLLEKEGRTWITILYENLLSDAECGPYVASFCRASTEKEKEHGLLSQWRGYGADGGYAIAFETKKIEALLKLERDRWAYDPLIGGDAVYSDDDEKIEEELGPEINDITSSIKRFYQITMTQGEQGREEAERALDKILLAIWKCSSRCKHWGFKEEKEVRIVAIRQTLEARKIAEANYLGLMPEKPIKHFVRRGMAVPYIDLFADIPVSSGKRLPITRIIVGPHREKEKEGRRRSVEILLKQNGIDAPVLSSRIPYLERS